MSEEGNYSRRSGPRDRQLRVGNAEREAVADILRREHLAGRLDNDEFDERVARCLAAKTYAELDGLIGDLPADERDARQAAGTGGGGPGPCRFSSYRSWSRRSSSATAEPPGSWGRSSSGSSFVRSSGAASAGARSAGAPTAGVAGHTGEACRPSVDARRKGGTGDRGSSPAALAAPAAARDAGGLSRRQRSYTVHPFAADSTPLGKRLMLVYLTGRKSGRHYRQPISYVREGETLLTPGGGR